MTDPAPRRLIVVDVETSALTPAGAIATTGFNILGAPASVPYGVTVELAWWDLDTGDRGLFVPYHPVHWVRAYGEPQALVVSRYLERLVDAEQADGTMVRDLHARLTGNTLAGANPAFDAKFLTQLFRYYGLDPEPWHHRLADLEAYAAGRLGLDPRELLGLAKLCDRLGVDPPDHTAAGDVGATGRCFLQLSLMAAS